MRKRKNRKFIDRRYDTVHSFKVVQRSQKDPLVADETAPQGVLVDTECSASHEEELQKYGIYFDDDYDYLQHLRGVKEAIDWENCDLEVYTIRHEDPKLKKKSESDGLVLPSSVFESYVEEPIGLLNKAAPITGPQLDLDPDIVAGLDSDQEGDYYDPEDENGIPDDFVSLLKGGSEDEEEDEKKMEGAVGYRGIQQWLGGTSEYYGCNDAPQGPGYEYMPPLEETFEDECDLSNNCLDDDLSLTNGDEGHSDKDENEEIADLPSSFHKRKAKTKSTSRRSTSSSTLPRTELQKTRDLYFERYYNLEWSMDKIGALDGEVIEGPLSVDSPQFIQAYETTMREFEKPTLASLETAEKKETVEWIKQNMKARNYMEGEKEEFVNIRMEPKLKYDVESYHAAQARANAKRRPNLPHVIDDRAPRKAALTKKAVKEHNQANPEEEDDDSERETPESEGGCMTLKSQISILSERPKGETPDERRGRKKALKELRRERREEKKENKLYYKEIRKMEMAKTQNKGNIRIVPLTGLV